MKTLVLTGCNEAMREIYELTIASKRQWAAQHGYDLLEIRQWQERPAIVWQKMAIVRELLGFRAMTSSNYECVVWLDADSIITNPILEIKDLAVGHNAGLFVSEDWGPVKEEDKPFRFNTGNFIAFNDAVTHSIFSEMFRIGRLKWWDRWGYEQSALEEIKRTGSRIVAEFIRVLPGRVLNAVPRSVQETSRNPWDEGCFLAHITGLKLEERLEILQHSNWWAYQ